MLVGKALWAHQHKKAHMICELSPYSCMPNTMSIGAMAGRAGKHPDLLYAPLEIKGDAEVHALSRCQMILTEAKKRAQREFDGGRSSAPVSRSKRCAPTSRRTPPCGARRTACRVHESRPAPRPTRSWTSPTAWAAGARWRALSLPPRSAPGTGRGDPVRLAGVDVGSTTVKAIIVMIGLEANCPRSDRWSVCGRPGLWR